MKLLFTLLFSFVLYTATGAVLKGRVTDAGSGEAVTGAQITVQMQPARTEISGLDGSFRFNKLTARSYRITVHAAGYIPWEQAVIILEDETQFLDIRLETATQTLQTITVSARKDGFSDRSARNTEKNAAQVMNVVSGQAIRLSPDLTVANVIQRVSGISIERNSNGDGQYAIVRGMDKRYNYTLVNGIKIPSPDNKYRYVPLDIFPSDLLERLEVYKALTPSMEGDAIGGAVNMVMKDAPPGLTVQATVASGFSELFANRDFTTYDVKGIHSQSPYEQHGSKYNATSADFPVASADYRNGRPNPNIIGGLALGNRLLHNKLGIIVAASYQNTYRGSNSTFYDIEKVDTFKGVTLTQYTQRQYSEQQIRWGVHAKADYRLNKTSKLQWYNAFMGLDNIQVRDSRSVQLTIGGYDPEKGNATMSYATRTRLTRQQIFNSTLQGEHLLQPSWKLDWSLVYSVAAQQQPDNTNIPLVGTMVNFAEQKTYVQDATRRWEHNTDKDLAVYANIAWKTKTAGLPTEWKAGGLFRDKKRTSFYNQYQMRPTNLKALYDVDFVSYTDIEWTVQNPRGSVASALNFDASEQITAGFLQFKTTIGRTEILGGLRAEHTSQGYEMQFPIGEDRPEGTQDYTDWLPSIHLKYMPGNLTNIRASYYRAVNRPGFFEIVPYKIVNEEYQERGNPDLDHAIADNIDVRYEWFPKAGEQFMAGIFFKNIQNPIEYTLQRDAVRGQDIYYTPGNFGTARNYGVEIDFIKYIRQWGVKANYTYTHSSITTSKSRRIRNGNGDLQTIQVDQERPLYGQAAHIANLSLLYKNIRYGWDVQLAGNYTGERIVTVSQYADNDFWQKGFVQMDASLEKTWGNKWSLYAKVNNILNTPMEVYMKTGYNNADYIPEQDLKGQTLIRRDYYQRSYVLGLRWKL